ncbi:hypothetical protein B9N43_03525 [Denitratisoma sp. DHT3]|uniref:MucB/RseB C-terminal domain-containing protein n=1 Tax=Denitratisoma sp. DHT3 TaxID=1981880 RepID=UPI0011983411|nr:MucB/RseB C-terminal domain-containing protein [Denitratisoma sp. DHT3]QDX80413.1 hypothetical protein B9N43_03525 [Denitratisoma sp. DHT3]
MMVRRWVLVGLVGLSGLANAAADTVPDALQWLQRGASSTRKLSYSGVFVYQGGDRSEASRIAHVMENGRELERIEALDGSPREVVREGDEIKCYIPDQRLLVLERSKGQRSFPAALLPEGIVGLTDYYSVRRGPPGRIAGFDAQSIVVEPKDELRYRRQFWIETQSGLMLKASLLDEQGNPRESFAFTEVHIGGPVPRDSLKAHAKFQNGEWRVHDIRSREMSMEDSNWTFRAQLPGFVKISGMKRQSPRDGHSITHLVFSDGLAAVSLFIEPLDNARPKPETGAFAMGTVNVYKRLLADHLLMAMGDVPLATLVKLADGVEVRRK